MKAHCPLLTAKTIQALATTTPRITDWRQGRTEPPKARGRAFQFTVEKARAASDILASMFPIIILSVILWHAYV